MNEYIQDIIDQLLDETMSWATRGQRAQAVFEAIGAVFQLWEDMRFDLEFSTRLPQATNQFLEQWGELVNEKRGNLVDDDEYRRIIRAKIQANRSNAFPQELVGIVQTLYEPFETTYHELYPAHLRIHFVSSQSYSTAFLRRSTETLQTARPAGVGLEVVQTPANNILRLQDTEQSFDGPQFSRRLL